MASEQDMQTANESIKSIMELLGILRVVSVDDFYDKDINIEDLVGLVCDDKTNAMQLIPSLTKDDIQDTDITRSKIITYMEGLDESLQTALKSQFVDLKHSLQGSGGQNDAENMHILGSLISTEKLHTLSLQEWEEQRDSLLLESKSQKTLFLFDQDMGNQKDGIRLISGLLAGKANQGIICGLLTHTVQPEDLPEAKDILSDENDISKENRDRFMVIPKRHLPGNPILFAQIMKLLALSLDFSNLKKSAKKIYEESLQKASDDIEKISIYDLDHIIFHTTEHEGLWEPDMLFRLFSLFQRLKARELAYETNDLEALTQKLRIVSQIPTPIKDQFKSNVWELQRNELYDQSVFINKNHLPLELGDIFQKANATPYDKHYILLVQPCDLMVRKDGKRAFDIHHLTLAEIQLIPDATFKGKTKKQQSFYEELEYFDVDNKNKWYVRLNNAHHVWACILDLCVFNSDGHARLILDANAPDQLRPSWTKRFLEVKKHLSKIRNRIEKKIVNKNQYVDFITDSLFKCSYTKTGVTETVEFDCKRVCRLSKERAFGLLMAYTSILGRPGYDKDFGTRD